MPADSTPPRRWAAELLDWWSYYNDLYLRGALRPPVLRVGDGTAQLGSWTRETRTLSIGEHHIRRDPWLEVLETLRHEMAHQFADEVLKATDEAPHGTAFRRACQLLQAEGHGRDPEQSRPDPAAQRMLDRIHKLLSLGESPNQNEAQAALDKARELLLRHQLEGVGAAHPSQYEVRWLGDIKGRHPLWEQLLGALLGEFFFVRVIWVHSYDPLRDRRGTVLEIAGNPEHLAMANYVHGFLCQVLPALWRDYRTNRGLTGNRDRLRFFAGAVRGFRDKMRAQDQGLRQRFALVPVGDPALDAFVRRRHPSTRTSRTGGHARSQAYEDGVAEGQRIRLRRPLGDGGSGEVRFLPDGG
ncbi:MAG: DUF2786 domain-containing protein [Planctomycetota bacterium]